MPRGNPTVRTFAPETWGSLDAFIALSESTYSFDAPTRGTLGGVRRHFEKAMILGALALKLRPNLDIDRQELEERSYTAAANGAELSAVVEAAINELYSSLDCTAKVVHAIYKCRGFKESTSGLFDRALQIGGLPDQLKALFGGATWEQPLRKIRTELTHHSTGQCDIAMLGGPVRYLHSGVYIEGALLEVQDIFAWLELRLHEVNGFLGGVFDFLLTTLSDKPVNLLCGMVGGRGLMRAINPTAHPIDFHSGTCLSLWIENPELPTCPFIVECGAYRRTRPGVNPVAIMASKINPEPWLPPGPR